MTRSKFVACLALSAVTVCGLVQADDYNAGARKASAVKPGSRAGFRKATDAGPSSLSRWFKDFTKPKVAAETKKSLPDPVATRVSQREVQAIARGTAVAPEPIVAPKAAPASVPNPTMFRAATAASGTGCNAPNCRVCNPCQCNSCKLGFDNCGQGQRPRRARRLARLRNRVRRVPGGSRVGGRRAFGFADAGITPRTQTRQYPYQSHEWAYHPPYNYKHIPGTTSRWGQVSQVNYQSPYSNQFFSSLQKRHEETRKIETAPTEFLGELFPLGPGTSPEEYAPEDFAPADSVSGQFTPEEFAPPRPSAKERASFMRPNVRQVSSANQWSKPREFRNDGGGIGIWESR